MRATVMAALALGAAVHAGQTPTPTPTQTPSPSSTPSTTPIATATPSPTATPMCYQGLVFSLNNPQPAANDNFGNIVALSDSLLLVAAAGDDPGITDVGVVYLYDAVTGILARTLDSPAQVAGEYFGAGAHLQGNYALVGARGNDTGAAEAGIAYLFDASNGALLRTFINPAPGAGDAFGSAVWIDGNNLLVGAYRDDAGAADSGSAYLFDAVSGNLLQTFNNPTPISNILSYSPNINKSNEKTLG